MKKTLPFIALLVACYCSGQTDSTNKYGNVRDDGKLIVRGLGVLIGTGRSDFHIKPNDNINSSDSVRTITPRPLRKMDLGFLYYKNLGKGFCFRPSIFLSFDGAELLYDRVTRVEKLDLGMASLATSLPILFRFSTKKLKPYVSAGPGFFLSIKEDEPERSLFPTKKVDVVGEVALGLEFLSRWLKARVSPEIKYSSGLKSIREPINTVYSNTISFVRRSNFTFTLYLREPEL
jgi:hypothetical protein